MVDMFAFFVNGGVKFYLVQHIQMCLQVPSDLMSLALDSWQCRSQKYELHIENLAKCCCLIYLDEQLGVSNHGACKLEHEPLL